ncbi:MJ1244 family protein [Methanobacterium paludis]|uniref:Uncharacterized protein n=1 Tax=Methanobacterium paludis (strain DSM 25820 / JCM 18151 / SWAN1) TaxID=868131 RepID=F6D770_METPW|nr:MJ1244 family protein [Methanobacterium paludis]AEG19029.1 Protein of unknown function, nitrogen regulatory protein PII-related protein [Methanobacterium paludis]
MKIHLQVFVETENLGKAVNALTDAGITGFYILEYRGISPQDWKGFTINEDPKSAIGLIKDYSTEAVLISSIVDEKKVDAIVELLREALKDERYTVLEVPIRRIIVNYAYQEKPEKKPKAWIIENEVPCFYCGEKAIQRIQIDRKTAKVWCTNCGAARYYLLKGEKPEG